MNDYFFEGASILELFSCYESILPSKMRRKSSKRGPVVGIGWNEQEMRSNPDLVSSIQCLIAHNSYLQFDL